MTPDQVEGKPSPKFVGPYCLKQRKLAKIWRAIARRHLSRLARAHVFSYRESDGESDP
jgi:hypothetical protein